MSEIVDVFVPLDDVQRPLRQLAARALGRGAGGLGEIRLLRRALDARRGHQPGFRLRLEIGRPGEMLGAALTPRPARSWSASVPRPRVAIVGSGPAGLWAALRLAEAGVPCTVLERGRDVRARRHDVAAINRGVLDPESNYCFGEGGAGTYSDGKLYTRAKDRAGVGQVLADLMRFGAPPEIGTESRPHVGSNRLPRVVQALREHLEGLGVEFRFGTRLAALVVRGGRVCAVRLGDGGELPADVVVLGAGHSARDVVTLAADAGLPVERKPFAVGVRIEHPQPVIDALQYGRAAGHPALPPAFYELKSEGAGRSVYSFCMCPGGFVVPAATESDGIVVNGMSPSRRDNQYANSGWVVPIPVTDDDAFGTGPLAGIELQRSIERAAFNAGGGRFRAPAQRLQDFVAGRPSEHLPASSYHPGLAPVPLEQVLPAYVAEPLREGLRALLRRVPAFGHRDAVMIAAETRTSAPVRILRDPQTLQSPGAGGVYPVGEGAGYAGGIVSAAMDGVAAADRILDRGA